MRSTDARIIRRTSIAAAMIDGYSSGRGAMRLHALMEAL